MFVSVIKNKNMSKIKKLLINHKVLLIIIFIGIIISFFYFKNINNEERIVIPKPDFDNFSETLGLSVINCQFKVISDFVFKDDGEKDRLIKYGTDIQNKPGNLVFSGLDSERPVLKGNNGEDPLMIISNNEKEITLASSNSFGDIFLYKIYKVQKVATWYKSYDMFGSPYALLSMGYCY